MKEAPRQSLIFRSDEPKLEIGDVVPIKEGGVGVVLARFIPSGESRTKIHYIVELRSQREAEKGIERVLLAPAAARGGSGRLSES